MVDDRMEQREGKAEDMRQRKSIYWWTFKNEAYTITAAPKSQVI